MRNWKSASRTFRASSEYHGPPALCGHDAVAAYQDPPPDHRAFRIDAGTPPREERDLLIAANNSWIVAYDNLSGTSQWLSDALCRLSTGGGFSTRELHSDNEEILFEATRPVILNGIDD